MYYNSLCKETNLYIIIMNLVVIPIISVYCKWRFNVIIPKKTDTPRMFELFKVDNLNNKLEFTILPNRSAIISNQVKSYMIVIVGYIRRDKNKIPEDNEKKNNLTDEFDIISKQIIIKDKKDLENQSDIKLRNQGKMKVVIEKPPDVLKKESVSGFNVEEIDILYRFGLMANYGSIRESNEEFKSNIIGTTNLGTQPFKLDDSFDYRKREELYELGLQYQQIIKEQMNKEKILENPNIKPEFKFEQMADKLGGFPDNLHLTDPNSTLENLVFDSLAKGKINIKVK